MAASAEDQMIVEHILASKKYRDLYRPAVERALSAAPAGDPPRQREEFARNTLHQLWGAYWETRPDFHKLFHKIEPTLADPALYTETLRTLMRLHASTAERLPIIESFFKRIWEVTGDPAAVIDHGCGFAPLAFPWMALRPDAHYAGYDIDHGQNAFVNRILRTAGVDGQLNVQEGDLLADTYPYADVVFMLNLLPVIEAQAGHSGVIEVLARQKCSWLIVSYPTASIGGRDKGMTAFYRERFSLVMKELGGVATELEFPEELVFVVRR